MKNYASDFVLNSGTMVENCPKKSHFCEQSKKNVSLELCEIEIFNMRILKENWDFQNVKFRIKCEFMNLRYYISGVNLASLVANCQLRILNEKLSYTVTRSSQRNLCRCFGPVCLMLYSGVAFFLPNQPYKNDLILDSSAMISV